MIPFVVLAAILAAFIALPKLAHNGDKTPEQAKLPPVPKTPLSKLITFSGAEGDTTYIPPGEVPLPPELERFLALMVLWCKDKFIEPKMYLTREMAREMYSLAIRFEMPKTARAIRVDGAIPRNEFFPGSTKTVAEALLIYAKKGRV